MLTETNRFPIAFITVQNFLLTCCSIRLLPVWIADFPQIEFL